MPTSVLASPSPRSVAGTPRAAGGRRLRKQCTAPDCGKVDAGGGFCVAHGGGKKCSFSGCEKGYQTGGFCRQHGGGARCQVEGCGKVDAGRGLCRAHGGGKRCQVDGCTKADVGGGFCTAHGGGKRCAEPGCTKIDQGGGKCRAHGGARRCRKAGCSQPARGASGLCSDHGGAQLCATPSCRRLAKADGSKLCTGCVKGQVKTEDDEEHDDEDSGEHKAGMPSFAAMLARNSPQFEYIPPTPSTAMSGMEPFHAFVQAAEAVEMASSRSGGLHFDSPSAEFIGAEQPAAAAVRAGDEADPDAAVLNMGSCLDNGCSKGFGGRCNCKVGCTCCSRARAAERANGTPREATTAGASAAAEASSSSSSSPSPPVVSFLPLKRIVVHIHESRVPLAVVKSMLKGIAGVRSVHRSSLEHRTSTDETSMDATESPLKLVLRCDPGFDEASVERLLASVGLHTRVEATSTVDWPLKEIVLKVADMMCPGNCGRTVMTVMQQVRSVHIAHLAFDERCVIARGEMSNRELCDAVDAIGFEPVVVVEMPLPKRFKLRVNDFASVHMMGHRLRELLLDIEGVESVVLMVERAEVFVEGTLEDAGVLLQAAHANQIMMVEVPDDTSFPQASPFDPTTVGRPCRERAKSGGGGRGEEEGEEHVCDVKVCPRNGCEQYMVTVAHTAALAVGWSVPGCAMGWGGECTCGESCKCKGCPQHNPAS